MIKFRKIAAPLFDRIAAYQVLTQLMNEMADAIREDFLSTVQTWDQKPEFDIKSSLGPLRRKLVIKITTDDNVYHWVTRGAKPHIILSKNADDHPMVFDSEYQAKTSPVEIESSEGGDQGGPIVYAYIVKHPGIEARLFDEQIEEKWNTLFPIMLENALGQFVKASGHAVRIEYSFSKSPRFFGGLF